MHPSFRAFRRFRPRILTLVVFVAVAAVIVLANLSFDEAYDGDGALHHRSFGWPIVWHRLILTGIRFLNNECIVGWYYSAPRLAANLLLCLIRAT
jgi:hypothetical protein